MEEGQMRNPTTKEKKCIQAGKLSKKLLFSVLYTINKFCKSATTKLLKSINEDVDAAIEKLYKIKYELLNLFLEPSEIHVISGQKYLFFVTDPYTGFHSILLKNISYPSLQEIVIDRNHTPKLQKTETLSLEFCLKIFKLRYKLKLI